MGLGDFLEGAGRYVKKAGETAIDTTINTTLGGPLLELTGLNPGKFVRQGVGSVVSGEGTSGLSREGKEIWTERGTGPVGPIAETIQAGGTLAKGAWWAANNPSKVGAGVTGAIEMIDKHPGQAWDVGFEVARHMAKDSVRPENIANTTAMIAATAATGGLGASGRLSSFAGKAAPEIEAGLAAAPEAVSAATKTSRLASLAKGMGEYDKFLGTGEATLAKKILHPVNTFITQPIKDRAAQAILNVGGEAGAARQGLAMAVQGGGVQPKALTGLSEEGAAAQQTIRRVKGVQNRTSQFHSAREGTKVLADPKEAAANFAMDHKQEAIDYASSHPSEALEVAQKVEQARGGGGNQPPPFKPVQTGGTPAEEPQPQSLSNNQFTQQPVLQQPSNSQPSSAYAPGRGFQANQGMGQVSQPGSQRSARLQAALGTALSFKSQKRFYEGPNREVFRGVDASHDWRNIEMRDNKFSFKLHPVQGIEGPGRAGAEPDPSNMRQPNGQTGPQPELSASVAQPASTESVTSVAKPYISLGEQPTGALNPAVPRTIQPAKAPDSDRKISAQQNRSEFFKSGSVFDRNAALPPLSQPMARPQRQRDLLGV